MDINTILDEVRGIKESLEQRAEAIEAEKRALEQEKAALNNDNPAIRNQEKTMEVRDIINSMKEKRAITLNGTGSINFVPEVVKDAQIKRPLLGMARTFYGRDAQTNISIFSPTLAKPGKQVEGADGIAADSQATLGSISVAPHSYVSILPVTHEALLMSSADIESELPSIFADAFADAMYRDMVKGTGLDDEMTGIFADSSYANKIACEEAGAPKMRDLVNLALELQDYADNALIVMNPKVYSAITATADASDAAYKEELIRNKTIEGVKVVLTSAAPATADSGKAYAVGLDMKNYALAIAQDVVIEPLKKVGDTKTYYQATMFLNGRVIHSKNVWALTAV